MPISQHEAKMVNLQQNLRENQHDLQEFLSDMTSWESEMKEKDSQLKRDKPVNATQLPPVRNSIHKKRRKKIKKTEEKNTAKQADTNGKEKKRISSYDYRSWDKFDIDKALEEVDGEKETSSSEYETDEDWENERKKHLGEEQKEKGNDLFRNGEYDGAIECYSRGIDLDPSNPLLHANRAMALIKQQKYGAAEVDATTAISLDPMYIKAYMRRASCRIGMNKLEEARSDYQRILNLEPQNKAAKAELEKLEKQMNRSTEEQPEMTSFTSSESGIVMPIHKPPEQRSKKPLRRVVIEEIGVEVDTSQREAIAKVKAKQSEARQKITEKDEQMFEKFTESNLKPKSVTITEVSSNDSDMKISPKETQKSEEYMKANTSELAAKTKTREVTAVVPSSTSLEDVCSKGVPQTSFQFQADYKVLKHDKQAFYQYFKKIPPARLPALFGEMLDSDILVNILCVLRDFFMPASQSIEDHLVCLTKVKRFDMTAMFFSRKEKEIVKELIDSLKQTTTTSVEDLNKLAKKYGVS